MESKYDKAERIGREYTKKLCEQYGWECSFITKNKFSSYDGIVKLGGKTCMMEIKVRYKEWPDYVLEDLKLTEMEDALTRCEDTIDKVLYFNWINDDICYIFDLGDVVDGKLIRNTKQPIREEDKRIDKAFNKHTVESREIKEPKLVYYLIPKGTARYDKQADGTYKKSIG